MPSNNQARVKMTPKTQAGHIAIENVNVANAPSRHGEAVANQPNVRPLRAAQQYNDRSLVDRARDIELLATRGRSDISSGYLICKRAFDVTVGIVLLPIATPIVLVAALAIRVNTPGSPFFFQTRLGKNGKPFRIFKLRGMYIDSRSRFATLYDYSKKRDLEFFFHHEDDPRVTQAGKFFRKTSIDELPNLWNVITGDMSLVGPRPEIPDVLELYGPYQDEYLSVKPGITCLSKCTGRDKLTKRETIELDLDYIRRRSFSFDLRILWRTFRCVILRRDVF
jgi:lipopolysaccharide/colanic/teichoic acid biosynthesis glycosyltransferase